ncbi:MAG: flagellar protein FlgN [Oscillospiraceae bacterium]|jgi:flagellar biosynthesis/type III secretory pathway chaperone
MDAGAKEIFDAFSEAKTILERSLCLSAQKKSLIIKGNAGELGKLLAREEELTDKLIELESKLNTMCSERAVRLGRGGGKLSLSELIEMTDDEQAKERFDALRREISDIIRKQAKLNRTNRELIRRKMNYVDAILGALVSDEQYCGTYDSKGSVDSNYGGTGLFDLSV